MDEGSLVPPLRQCLNCMGKGAQCPPRPLEARQRPPPVGKDVDKFGVKRVCGGQPISVARLPVACGHCVTQGFVPVGIGIGHCAPLLHRSRWW